jgi:hypothetical protein
MRVTALIASMLAGAATALMASPRPAAACSCGYPEPIVSPPDGATDVPVNATIFIGAYVPSALQRATLIDVATGATVDATQGDLGDQVTLRPTAPLAAGTTYRVSFDNDLQGPYETTFTTGSGVDDVAPTWAGLTGATLSALPYPGPDGCENSCISPTDGWYRKIQLDVPAPPADVVSLVMHIYNPTIPDDRGEYVAIYPVRYSTSGVDTSITEGGCRTTTLPRFLSGQTFAVEVIAYDAAGNVAERAAPIMATVPACAEAIYDDVCTPTGCADDGSGGDDGGGGGSSAAASGCTTTGTTGGLPTSPFALLGVLAVAPVMLVRRRR